MPRTVILDPVNLRYALEQNTVDKLKLLAALLPKKPKSTRKGELIAFIESHLQGDRLCELWDGLDDVQQLAIAEATYSEQGVFIIDRFKAKYGAAPNFGARDVLEYNHTPSLLSLFFHSVNRRGASFTTLIPNDLRKRLQAFVEKPKAFTLQQLETLPQDAELTHRDTERAVQIDLPVLLRLIDDGKVSVSNKTFQPSLATMKLLAQNLSSGDFYELKPKKQQWNQDIGPIKAFAWPLLLQAAKLVELSGSKLKLTKTGRQALTKPVHEVLHLIWQRWTKTTILDEFSRINEIKGQQGKGKRSMTATNSRRSAINGALAQCPVGRWVAIDEFWRFMQAADFHFEVTRDPWRLYIVDREYGSLGYQDYHHWSVVQGRYVLCVLFEYAATLGMIDVAYKDPVGARRDFSHMWGTDDLDFLSRYDGLQYIRLSSLGAYCLGLTAQYSPTQIQTLSTVSMLPSLKINIIGNPLSDAESLILENYAKQESELLWHLDKERSLLAVENGHRISELREFLEARDDQPLPETVEHFISTIQKQGQALRHQGTAILIECMDSQLADLVSTSTHTKSLCERVGKRHLVVKTSAEEKFRKAIHELGYGMPKV